MMPDKLKLPFAKLLKAKNNDTMKAKFNTDSGYPDLVLNYFSQLDALIDSYISFGRLTNAAKSFADDLDVIADAQESYILCVNAFAKLRGLNPIYEARLPSIILSDIFVEQARCMWQLLCRHSCGDTSVAVSFDIDTSLRAVFYPDEARELWSSIFPTAVNAPDRFKVVTRADVGVGYANHCDTVGLMLNVAIAMCGHDFADAKFIKSFVTGLVALPVCVPPAAVTATDTALASADALGVQPLSEVEVELQPDAQTPLSPLSPPSGDSPPIQAELFSGVIPKEHCPAIDCINTLVCTYRLDVRHCQSRPVIHTSQGCQIWVEIAPAIHRIAIWVEARPRHRPFPHHRATRIVRHCQIHSAHRRLRGEPHRHRIRVQPQSRCGGICYRRGAHTPHWRCERAIEAATRRALCIHVCP